MSDVAAVVVRWRGGDEVARCLRSLRALGGPRLGSMVLVDSASGDGGADVLAQDFPDIRVERLPVNLGFAAAANHGVARTAEPLVLLLNPDTELIGDAVTELLKVVDERPRTAGAVPLLEGLDGASQHRWQLRSLPTVLRLAAGLPGAPAFSRRPPVTEAVAQPAAAAWLVRRSVWRELGGLDPAFRPAWWEDVDFCRRLDERIGNRQSGCDEGFSVVPRARVRHAGGSSAQRLGAASFLGAYYSNLLRYAARHHRQQLATVRIGLRLGLRLRMIVRPRSAEAYQSILRGLRTATPGAPGPPRTPRAAG